MSDLPSDLPMESAPPDVHVQVHDFLWIGNHDSVVLNCHADPTWGAMLMQQDQVVSVNDEERAIATLVAFGIVQEHAEAMVAEAVKAH